MVSFDRPYASDHGAGNFLDWEFYYVRWLEQSGYDVAYSTDLDTHRNGRTLLHYKGFLSVGHDEYWTREMYDNVTTARDAGVSLGFFGANAIYWQIRFARSAAGVPDRIEVCYKDAALDPVHGASSTVRWRDPPVDRPEQQLIGVQFTSEQPDGAAPAPFVPIGTDNTLYQGSPASAGRAMGHVIGYETDRQFDTEPLPNFVPRTYALLSDSPYLDVHGRLDHQNSVIYQAGSGAWVFGAGSIEWSWGLYDDAAHRNADPVVRRLTGNVLDRFMQPHRAPPSRPTRLQATATGPRTVHLTWSAATGSAHPVVERSVSPSFDPATGVPLAPDARDYTDDGLQPGVYYYRVHVVDGDGESPYSDPVGVATISYAALAGRVGVLLAQWRLGDRGPAVVDRTGTYSGTVGAGVTPGVPGAITNDPDRAMGFDGRVGAVRLPDLPQLTDFTLTGWTKLNGDARGNDSGDNALFAGTGRIRLLPRPGTGTASAYAGLWVGGKEYALDPGTHQDNVGRWVFWALTRQGGTLTLYRDGVPIDRRTDLPAAGTVDVSGSIGAQDGDTYNLHGVIDEVAVYRSPLTADDLMALYQAALTGPKP
jgi:hypothetical protein